MLTGLLGRRRDTGWALRAGVVSAHLRRGHRASRPSCAGPVPGPDCFRMAFTCHIPHPALPNHPHAEVWRLPGRELCPSANRDRLVILPAPGGSRQVPIRRACPGTTGVRLRRCAPPLPAATMRPGHSDADTGRRPRRMTSGDGCRSARRGSTPSPVPMLEWLSRPRHLPPRLTPGATRLLRTRRVDRAMSG